MKSPETVLREELGDKRYAELEDRNLSTLVQWSMIKYKDQFENENVRSEKEICPKCHSSDSMSYTPTDDMCCVCGNVWKIV